MTVEVIPRLNERGPPALPQDLHDPLAVVAGPSRLCLPLFRSIGLMPLSFARTLPDSFNRLPRFPGDSEPCGDGLRVTRRPTCQTTQLHARTVRRFWGVWMTGKRKRPKWGRRARLRGRPAVLDYAARLT